MVDLIWFASYFYILVISHISIMLILIKKSKIDSILVFISTFLSLFFCCLGFWELYVTSSSLLISENGLIHPIPVNFYVLGFYGFQTFPIYIISIIFYIYHLTIRKTYSLIKVISFGFICIGITLVSGLVGDFSFFILKGLGFFNPIDAYWLIWNNGFPISYLWQLGLGGYFLGLSWLINIIPPSRKHKKSEKNIKN